MTSAVVNNNELTEYKKSEKTITDKHTELYKPKVWFKKDKKTAFFNMVYTAITSNNSLSNKEKSELYTFAAATALATQGRKEKTELATTFGKYAAFYQQANQNNASLDIKYRGQAPKL